MFTRISVARLYVGSVYKLVFLGLLLSLFPLCIVFGVLAAFGFSTIQWNGQPVYGINGLLLSPLLGVMMVLLFTAFLGTACMVGLWMFSKFRPLSLWAKNVEHYASEVA